MSSSESNYANFHDPIGLALRMLRTASRESVGPLLQMGCELAAKPLDLVASRWEKFDVRDDDIPQILIVGLPRTGTTLVSQVLGQYLDVSYFPNASAFFPSAPIWATKRCAGTFAKAPSTTKNFFGSTAGILGINDGFHIWNRWLGTDRYSVERIPSDDEMAEMQAFFGTWSGVFGKPLLNKNNRNVDGIELLAKILPNAVFVVVDRDPGMTVQSLLLARKFVQGTDKVGWGLYANQAETESDPIASVCEQVAYGIRRMNEQLSNVLSSRVVRFSYEEFCESPRSQLGAILDLVASLDTRAGLDIKQMPTLKANNTVRLTNEEWDSVQRQLTAQRTDARSASISQEA